MKDNADPHRAGDDIDRIVEALLANPDQSASIKTLLREKLGAPDLVQVAYAAAAVLNDDSDDADDFWDNVPI